MLDSIKFGLSLWLLTYIGSWFNAMTLVILSWVGLFTIPKVRPERLQLERANQLNGAARITRYLMMS